MRPHNLEQSPHDLGFLHGLEFLLDLFDQFSFVLHGILLVHLSIVPHTKKSIGFRSGKFGGQRSGGTKLTKLLLSQSCIFLDVWQGTKSCCHPHSLPTATLCIQGSLCISKTFRYSSMLILSPFKRCTAT